ncbi:hypothetical protein K470DRAFT_256614 [Piedraia hortae CBS 480.64]|uniref:HTH La-type RNA-binding domain-containing protein n=1 Tax=Piedraia hortae CBS 480.64 TaxID=1314780 RepID=A0A6A7C478_9PEZI|nr:hypothetical protein K470DRAFT_256614 [Piedraia hortae CBS 480.64]
MPEALTVLIGKRGSALVPNSTHVHTPHCANKVCSLRSFHWQYKLLLPAASNTTTSPMAAQVAPPPEMPPITVNDWFQSRALPGDASENGPHPQEEEIIRQVDYYFSDENLPHDQHLLALTGGDGNGIVRLSDITRFPRMRKFKQPSKVRAAISKCELVVFVDKKHIRRKHPLTSPITVTPEFKGPENDRPPPRLKSGPKSTGFEADAVEADPTAEQREQELAQYDPENSLSTRIEYAIFKFCDGRKMQQESRRIFSKFVLFGGFVHNPKLCQGGMTKKEIKESGDDEQAASDFILMDEVSEAIFNAEDGLPAKWVVDFEAVAKGFLGSRFQGTISRGFDDDIHESAQILRKFFQYIILKQVCPEYGENLQAALRVCTKAQNEMPKITRLGRELPDSFNKACATVCEGKKDEKEGVKWWNESECVPGLSYEHAMLILKLGLAAHGTEEQYEKGNAVLIVNGPGLTVISEEEEVGLEIVQVELPSQETKAMYENIAKRYKDQLNIKTTGKLICKRWTIPNNPPIDLPEHVLEEMKEYEASHQDFTFIVDENVLKDCEPGMTIEAKVKTFDVGLSFIDAVYTCHPSFYVWLANETISDWKEPDDLVKIDIPLPEGELPELKEDDELSELSDEMP